MKSQCSLHNDTITIFDHYPNGKAKLKNIFLKILIYMFREPFIIFVKQGSEIIL
jgi:hypothetical protein